MVLIWILIFLLALLFGKRPVTVVAPNNSQNVIPGGIETLDPMGLVGIQPIQVSTPTSGPIGTTPVVNIPESANPMIKTPDGFSQTTTDVGPTTPSIGTCNGSSCTNLLRPPTLLGTIYDPIQVVGIVTVPANPEMPAPDSPVFSTPVRYPASADSAFASSDTSLGFGGGSGTVGKPGAGAGTSLGFGG
jgi:hypothetical protein